MSRSKKKNPVFANAICESQKRDKQQAHRAFRRKERKALSMLDEELLPIKMEEVSDVWTWDADGKHFYTKDELEERDLQKYLRK